MRLIELPPLLTIALDFAAWIVIHMSFVFLTMKIPSRCFEKDSRIFRPYFWEDNGRIWQRVFKVKKWKKYLPDGGALFKKGFRKRHISSYESEYFKVFILESRRAELLHWLSLLPAPLFFLWNPFGVGCVMIVYAIIVNMPCIIAQRYNRPRFTQGRR